MKEIKQRFIIIDGNAIIHRAYHAIPPLTTKEGKKVNAVYGFTSMLLKVIADLKPTYLAVSFDMAGGTFRDQLYDKYKATRVKSDQELYDQIPWVHEVVSAFGIPIYEREGFEADDVIGTIVSEVKSKKPSTRAQAEGLKVKSHDIEMIIVSGDKDLLQLVDDNVEVYLLKKGLSEMKLYDRKKVEEDFGFPPAMMVDYKALRGDASDNIPGVKGIGEKTASELIKKIGGIDEIYRQVKSQKPSTRAQAEGLKVKSPFRESVIEKLKNDEAGARMSKELATIKCDMADVDFDLEKTRFVFPSKENLLPLFQKFEFVSLLKRVPGGSEIENGGEKKTKKIKKFLAPVVISVSSKNFDTFWKEAEKEKVFGCKEVVQGESILEGKLLGFAFATDKNCYYVDLSVLEEKQATQLYALFADKNKTFIGHDLKQVVKVLQAGQLELRGKLFDVMIASYVLNSSTRAHDMASIVLRELGEELAVPPKENLFGIDSTAYTKEVCYFRPLYDIYAEALKKDNNLGLFEQIEMELIPVLAHMELAGVAVDTKMLAGLSKDVADSLKKVIKKIWDYAGHEFNVASSVQLRDVLFEEMGLMIDGIKKGKTGFSTAASELEKLRGVHPIIECIEEHRELAKLQNTYIDVLPTLVNSKTHRIHGSFNQAVAATGRLSGSDPNLQNIPIRTELGKKIRDAFIAEPGNVLVVADYSQIELRIVASLAEDKKMMEIFDKGEDIHVATAAAINNVPLEKVTKEMRRAAKEVNFGVLYGMGAFGLASRTGISVPEAKEFIEKYFTEFAGVKKYVDNTLKFARETGYVETLFGRKRYIPDLKASNFQLRSAAERMAVNMPIQGTAADLMKMAMIAVYDQVKSKKLKVKSEGDVRMILQVHDELVLEVKKGLEDEVVEMVKETMEGVAQLKVPVGVRVGIGTRWGEMK